MKIKIVGCDCFIKGDKCKEGSIVDADVLVARELITIGRAVEVDDAAAAEVPAEAKAPKAPAKRRGRPKKKAD